MFTCSESGDAKLKSQFSNYLSDLENIKDENMLLPLLLVED
jgi:hypothetical protein